MPDLDERFRALTRVQPPDLWSEIEDRQPRVTPRVSPGRRLLVAVVALAVAVAGTALAVYAFRPEAKQETASSPSPTTTQGRCVHVETTGDFDGDGLQDKAELFDVVPRGETCRQDVSQYLRIAVQFASGQKLERAFTECGGGACDTIFSAVDLDGDGRSELAVEVGPGASGDYVEFFRVDGSGLRPLRVVPPGDPGYLKPGAAILGGSHDSIAQSGASCVVGTDGSRTVIFRQADLVRGDLKKGLWRMHRTSLVLQGDTLAVVGARNSRYSAGGIPNVPLWLDRCA